MAGETTLIVTTRSGVRPLGVRGEPLHNSAPQLRRVVRRRLGDGAADLLADPQLHEDGKAIDWYAGWPGAVRPLSALDARAPGAVLAEVEQYPGRHPPPGRCAGHGRARARTPAWSASPCSLPPARRPTPSSSWSATGRSSSAGAMRRKPPPGCCRPPCRSRRCPVPPSHRAVLEAPIPAAVPMLRPPPGATIPWARTLLASAAIVASAAGQRLAAARLSAGRPGTVAGDPRGAGRPRRRRSPRPDPKPALKASFSNEESRGRMLEDRAGADRSRAQEAHRRLQAAGSPEAAAPGRARAAAAAATCQARARPGAAAAACPAQRRSPAPAVGAHQRLLLHAGLLAHRSVPPRDHPAAARHLVLLLRRQRQRQLEWRRGRTACRTRAHAQFNGPSVCACATPTRTATTARAGTPTSWFAGAAPTASRCARHVSQRVRSRLLAVNLHKMN